MSVTDQTSVNSKGVIVSSPASMVFPIMAVDEGTSTMSKNTLINGKGFRPSAYGGKAKQSNLNENSIT